jgi:ABC-type multidrug transport system fused ATPase/permease subunit
MTLVSAKAIVQKCLLVSFSAFLIWQSIQLVGNIAQGDHSTTLGDILAQAILLNLFITGIFLVGYALPLHRLLPDSYYRSVGSKAFSSACSILKMELFRKMLRLTFWGPRNNRKHFFNGRKSGLAQFEMNTRISESSHILAFAIITTVSFYLAAVANNNLAIIATLINVVFNFYPAMLQRYHRSRLQIMMAQAYQT